MSPAMSDQALHDLGVLAAMVALAGVLVVAALWAAIQLRFDRVVQLAAKDVGLLPRAVLAGISVGGTLAILLGFVPSGLLLDPWAATGAALWVMSSMVALAATLSHSRRRSGINAVKAPTLPTARAA